MLASGLQSGNYLLSDPTRSSIVGSFNSQGPLSSVLNKLFSAIASGNLNDAKSALIQVKKVSPAIQSANTRVGRFISSVSSLLEDGNIAGAKSALADYRNNFDTSSDAWSRAVSRSDSAGSAASGLAQQVIALSNAIGSDNMGEASSACDRLIQSVATTSALSSAAFVEPQDDLTVQLQRVHSALNAGNLDTAQMALDGFLTSLSAGSLVDAEA